MRCSVRHLAGAAGIVLAAWTLGCGAGGPQPPPGLDEVQLAGWRAYLDLNCASCHGERREGRKAGPPLSGLARNWTAEELVSYLLDPDAMVRANPRLAYRAEQYAIGMPKVSGKTPGYADRAGEETLRALAGYLLVDPR